MANITLLLLLFFFFGIYTLKYVGTAAEKPLVKTADIKSGFPVSFQVNQEFHAN